MFFHFIVVIGIVLAAIGGSNLSKPESSSNSYSSDKTHLRLGYLLLLLTVVLLTIYAVVIYKRLTSKRSAGEPPVEYSELKRNDMAPAMASTLISWTLLAIIPTAVRVLYGVVYAFNPTDRNINPMTAGFAVKLILIFGTQFIAASFLILGGLISLKT